jgi:hypothetical protein
MASSISGQKHYRTEDNNYNTLRPVSKRQRAPTYEEKLPLYKRASLYRMRLLVDPYSKEKHNKLFQLYADTCYERCYKSAGRDIEALISAVRLPVTNVETFVRICSIINNNLQALQTSENPGVKDIIQWYEAATNGGFDAYQRRIVEERQSQAAAHWKESETEKDKGSKGSIRIALESAFQALRSFPLIGRDLGALEKAELEKYQTGVKELASRFYLPTDPSLPNELWVYIFSFLPASDLSTIQGVNKTFHNCSSTPSLWSSRLLAPISHPPSEGPQELQAAIKRQILQNTRCFNQRPIERFMFEAKGSTILYTWALKDHLFVLMQDSNQNTHTLYGFDLKKQNIVKERLPVNHALQHGIVAPDQFVVIAEMSNIIVHGKITADGQVNIHPLRYTFAQYPIKYFPHASENAFGISSDSEHFLDFQLSSEHVYYHNCEFDVDFLVGANPSFLIFTLIGGNKEEYLELVCRKTMKVKTLPSEIANGEYIEMTQNALYVEMSEKILRYDLHSETIQDLDLDLENLKQSTVLKAFEFENKVIIYCKNNGLHLFERQDKDGTSAYVQKWKRPIATMDTLTPTREFLILKEASTIILVDWASGNSLNRPFPSALFFDNYHLVTYENLQTEGFKIIIEKF